MLPSTQPSVHPSILPSSFPITDLSTAASTLVRIDTAGACAGYIDYDSSGIIASGGGHEGCKQYCLEEPNCRAVMLGNAHFASGNDYCWFSYASHDVCTAVGISLGNSNSCYNWINGPPTRAEFGSYVFPSDSFSTLGYSSWPNECRYKTTNATTTSPTEAPSKSPTTDPTEAPSKSPTTDLSTISSPYAGSTSSRPDNHQLSCGSSGGREAAFYTSLPAGATINIGQTSNTYDSRHELSVGGAFPGNTIVGCVDDPDYTRLSYTNTGSDAVNIYFVVDAYSTGSGDFTLTWEIDYEPSPTAPTTAPPAAECQDCRCQSNDGGWNGQYSDCALMSQTDCVAGGSGFCVQCNSEAEYNGKHDKSECATACRFDFTQSVGGMAGSMWQLSEIELYNGGSRIALTDSISNAGGAAYGNEGSLMLIDNNTSTKNCCLDYFSDTIVVTLTLPTPLTSPPTSYTFWTANDETDRDPTSWTFLCKNGDGAYTTLDTRSGVSPPSARSSQYPIYDHFAP